MRGVRWEPSGADLDRAPAGLAHLIERIHAASPGVALSAQDITDTDIGITEWPGRLPWVAGALFLAGGALALWGRPYVGVGLQVLAVAVAALYRWWQVRGRRWWAFRSGRCHRCTGRYTEYVSGGGYRGEEARERNQRWVERAQRGPWLCAECRTA